MHNADLPERYVEIARGILEAYGKIKSTWVFGSRARGTARRFSDLDILVETDSPLDYGELSAIEEMFSESDLPFRVDVIDSSRVSPEFHAAIKADLVPLY